MLRYQVAIGGKRKKKHNLTLASFPHLYAATVAMVRTARAPAPENLTTLLPNTENIAQTSRITNLLRDTSVCWPNKTESVNLFSQVTFKGGVCINLQVSRPMSDCHTFVSYFRVFQMSTISRVFGLQLWNLAALLILTCSFSWWGSLLWSMKFNLC